MIGSLFTAYQPSLADIANQNKGRALREAVSSTCEYLASVVRNSFVVLAARGSGPRLSVEETGFGGCGIPDSDAGGGAKACDYKQSVT